MTTEEIIAWKKNFPNILEKARSKANRRYPSILEIDDDAEFGEYDINEAKREIFIEGYLEAGKDLCWHSVDDCLPEVDEEVIVLTDELGTAPIYKIAFGHIVDKDRCLDYNGWNIPGVRFWMPCPTIPKEEEHESTRCYLCRV